MLNKIVIASLLFLFCSFSILAQNENNTKESKKKQLTNEVVIDSIIEIREPIDALRPAKAAFFSAILPGLGQVYNKKYWKVPLVYAAIGTGLYFYIDNSKQYNRYRDAYKSRLAGFTTDEFYYDSNGNFLETPRITTENLETAQDFYKKNKEISLLVTIGLYALNIIDANVDAHLMQYNVDENLSLAPHYEFNQIDATSNLGLTLNFKF
ncbi:hypothetical protein PK35_11950 [Tamlana nanhaiensis]|uniref:DUF5683 domain-containing protein n=1 Tax=Neotamlana nanhaiensis TaxID=1382798 RepID=A0A0D7VZX0_9FLAO|nr:DUF5683 domain-containing protein [Tamlana nanhaiensis]KJD32375.1 hypothetical protein PK35_11065 [Tamlana nanhaiensis]KJD32386.1 hypothetical protein PK35_11950 [Tamlana nanhaiensis]